MPYKTLKFVAVVALLTAGGTAFADSEPLRLQFKAQTSLVDAAAAAEFKHSIYFFPRADEPNGRQGFVRILNDSERNGTVTVHAIDESGTSGELVTLSLDAKEARHFNADDLERGNPDKGIEGAAGRPGTGDWRLELTTDLDIEVYAFVRTRHDGFLTSMHETVERLGGASNSHHPIGVFNPGSNTSQVSLLRLVNPNQTDTNVEISGRDDAGDRSRESVHLELAEGTSVTLSADELENGSSAFEGALGDGTGKWRLEVAAEDPIVVMNLMATPTGHITNLSAVAGEGLEVEEEVADDHGDTITDATRVAIPSNTAGNLEEGGDLDYFHFEVPRRMTIKVSTTSSLDTYGRLYDAGESLVRSNDDSGPGLNFEIVGDLDPGTYYVQVKGITSRVTGRYTLYVAEEEEVVQPLRAPTVTITRPNSVEVGWMWNVRPSTAYVFDTSIRVVLPDGRRSGWDENCDVWRTEGHSGEIPVWKRFNNFVINGQIPQAGTIFHARYRHRSGSVCGRGTPGEWSPIGDATF